MLKERQSAKHISSSNYVRSIADNTVQRDISQLTITIMSNETQVYTDIKFYRSVIVQK